MKKEAEPSQKCESCASKNVVFKFTSPPRTAKTGFGIYLFYTVGKA